MSEEQNGKLEERALPELKLSDLLFTETVRGHHEAIETEWDSLRRSAYQTVAGRALWKHVIYDPFAELLAGELYLRSLYEKIKKDCYNNARKVSGVMLAVRTLWFDEKIEVALSFFDGGATHVLLLGTVW
ncbi:hypothetical protein CsSME_00041620 [Camellia sinensis var. sinensis]